MLAEPAPTTDRWLRPDQAARHCKVSRRTIERWQARGLITTYKPAGGRLVLLDREELDRVLLDSAWDPEQLAEEEVERKP